jgi:phage shock protein A
VQVTPQKETGSMFKRIWRYLNALINGKLDEWEDPEIIINQATKEMKENQIKNRELAVQAITQKNNLQAEVDKEERMVAELERRATLALQSGNRELAKQFLKEKALHDQTLESMRTNLVSATEAAEKVKLAIKSEEERIRRKTAEALAMKANMKQAQIQIKINKALDQFQFSENEQQWGHVQERITSMQSEASARAEIANTSIDSKLREMEVSQMDVEADRQLAELEAKMQMGTSPAANYNTNNVQQVQTLGGGAVNTSASSNGNGKPESDIDRQLRELEEKLGRK